MAPGLHAKLVGMFRPDPAYRPADNGNSGPAAGAVRNVPAASLRVGPGSAGHADHLRLLDRSRRSSSRGTTSCRRSLRRSTSLSNTARPARSVPEPFARSIPGSRPAPPIRPPGPSATSTSSSTATTATSSSATSTSRCRRGSRATCAESPTARRPTIAAGGAEPRPRRAGRVRSCPVSSQIGTTNVAAGPGSHPFHAVGKMYLSGPFKGAPSESGGDYARPGGPLRLRHRRRSGSPSTSTR